MHSTCGHILSMLLWEKKRKVGFSPYKLRHTDLEEVLCFLPYDLCHSKVNSSELVEAHCLVPKSNERTNASTSGPEISWVDLESVR